MELAERKCVPCEGKVKPLPPPAVEELLPQVPGWEAVDYTEIVRDFRFKDFVSALTFVNGVGAVAERENHHPNILLHGWNKVRLSLKTHAIGGLSENDFILAAKINEAHSGI